MMLVANVVEHEEIDAMAAALGAAGLPTTDLREPDRRFFKVVNAALVGYAGLEGSGQDRLLRSVVVLPEHRSKGLGRALIRLIEACARDIGIERLHLLTVSAAPFFVAQGYVPHDRDRAPPWIRASRQFSSLCPASAAYLVKDLPAK